MSTYNPSANSPIKAQQPTNCPACGQPIQTPVAPMNNAMNRYVNDATGHVAVYNHGDEYITVSGVKLRREDVIKAISEPDTEGAVTPLASNPVSAKVIPSAQLAKQPVKVQVGVTEGAPEPQ
jgi:hypothetical protein